MKEIFLLMIILLVFSCCVSENKLILSESVNTSCIGDIDGVCPLNKTIESTTTTIASTISTTLNNPSNRIEVYHFHGNTQCNSCKTVGAYAEETINTYFADELKSGKLVFAHINYDLAENKALAEKYGVTGSSLWIGEYKGETFAPEQNVNVWYKINNKEDYMSYLKEVIESKLALG
jgi:hypothetical protein